MIESKIGSADNNNDNGQPLHYGSPYQLRGDFLRLYDNCMTYHAPGRSPYSNPQAGEVAGRVLAAVDRQLKLLLTSVPVMAALEFANGLRHWLRCRHCHKWRAAPYVHFAPLRVAAAAPPSRGGAGGGCGGGGGGCGFRCEQLPGRGCGQPCDQCGGAQVCSCAAAGQPR
eukprot:XP_001694408.1 predicted protein [Chlamydomonas reinhardtii]